MQRCPHAKVAPFLEDFSWDVIRSRDFIVFEGFDCVALAWISLAFAIHHSIAGSTVLLGLQNGALAIGFESVVMLSC